MYSNAELERIFSETEMKMLPIDMQLVIVAAMEDVLSKEAEHDSEY